MKLKRTAAHAWIDSIDPLFGVSISAAKSFFNSARRNGSPRLQKIYDEIEMNDPTILTCVERRAAALAGLSRTVTANPAVKDKSLAEEQVDALNEFILNIDNLDEVIEHMDLAFFRGFSVAQPIWLGSTVKHVEIFDSWNFLYGDHGELLWNPKCSMDPKDCEVIGPEAHLLFLKRRRAIDWPALIIYLRKYIGERDWGRFLERYGIPPVDVVMAANATKEDRAEYEKAANAAENGQNVVWPSNSSISRSETSRGQDPFSAFIDHQEREIVLMATGGTLTSLAQADTGALAGGAQMKVWEQIVARDAVLTNAIFNAALVRRFFELNFPGREIAAKFELGPEKTPTPTEVAELATKIKNAGYLVDQHQFEEATGFTLEKIESPAASPFPALNKKSPDDTARGGDKLLAAFASDMSPLGDAIKALLNDPSPAAAKSLIERLPSLLPDDPALATILADEMAKEFGVTEHLANSGTSEGAKKGWATRIRNGWTPKQLEDNKKIVDNLVSDLARKGPDGKGKSWKNEPKDLGEISVELASDIRRANPKILAMAGTMQTIDHAQLQHALNEHGVGREKWPNSVPITGEDLKRIPDILSSYDEIIAGKGIAEGKKQEAVIFRKKYADGTTCCVEIDWFSRKENRRELKFQTMWKEKLQK